MSEFLRQAVIDRFVEVLGQIARGRADGGRPLAGEDARQMAREALIACGYGWPKQERKTDVD
jgi:hypothetical protein